jgi:hypothetical protein
MEVLPGFVPVANTAQLTGDWAGFAVRSGR